MNASFARFVVLALPLLVACGGADPSQLTDRWGVPEYHDPSTTEGAATDPAASPSSGSTGGTTGGNAGADGGADTGSSTPPAPAPENAFTGAGAFVSKLGPSTRKDDHDFAGNTPTTSPKGRDCSGCHDFFMGGTVFADLAGTTPAAGVEVRVRDAAGNAASVWTDADGNFYLKDAPGALKLPAKIGVRNATTTRPMSATIASGACASSSCHVAGKQGPIHLP